MEMHKIQGIDADGIPYFDDLYLDLVVYPGGTIITAKAISQEQFNLAISTSDKLKPELLSNIDTFIEYTLKCKERVN